MVEEKVEELHGYTEDLFSLSRINSSICWQQSWMQWLRERDVNSKLFHSIMSSRRHQNAIQCFMVDGVLVEGVDNVCSTVFSRFSAHFQPRHANRPSMDAIHFRPLSCDVRFLHVIKLFTRKYNRIVSAGSCVYLKHFNVIYHVKCLGINCLFV